MTQPTLLEELLRRLAERFRAPRPPPQPELAPHELDARRRAMHAVSEMMSTEGWKIYRETVEKRVADLSMNILSSSAASFSSAENLEKKGIVIGLQLALSTATDIIEQGIEAAKRLETGRRSQVSRRIGT